MNDSITRRTALKLIATATAVGAASGTRTALAATALTRSLPQQAEGEQAMIDAYRAADAFAR